MATRPAKPSKTQQKPRALPPPKRKRNPGGRPAYEPTKEARNMVEGMVGVGIPHEDIAGIIGISENTLRKHFKREIDTGFTKANAAVGVSLFKKATGNGPQSVAAAIFWAKARMGWRETSVIEHRGRVEAIHKGMTPREASESYAQTRRRAKAA